MDGKERGEIIEWDEEIVMYSSNIDRI